MTLSHCHRCLHCHGPNPAIVSVIVSCTRDTRRETFQNSEVSVIREWPSVSKVVLLLLLWLSPFQLPQPLYCKLADINDDNNNLYLYSFVLRHRRSVFISSSSFIVILVVVIGIIIVIIYIIIHYTPRHHLFSPVCPRAIRRTSIFTDAREHVQWLMDLSGRDFGSTNS